MGGGGEVDDRVDLDEENYMEEMDDEAEEQLDEDGTDEGGEDNEEDDGEEDEAQDSGTGASGKDQSTDAERGHLAVESAEDEEKPVDSVDEEEKEKHAQLLSLPPHGSEVFIGGLPRECTEEDLRDLCDGIGEILEVRIAQSARYL